MTSFSAVHSTPAAATLPAGAATSPPSVAPPSAAVLGPAPPRHGRFEDAQALFSGSLFVGITMMMFNQAGLLTGGTAGLAFVLHYATGWSFGALYFVLNLPFYWFAWRHIGRVFTLKTFACVGILSAIVEFAPRYVQFNYLHPAFAAVAGGLLMGTGVLFLARHKASLGGATIAALYLQERYGVRAGKVQMAVDCSVVLLALWVVPLDRVAWSVLAAVITGVFLAVSHRPGRYAGQ